ncbi:c-type cytochrome [Pseudorhodoferax sp.]|uniref:c-type cytochrome n=1 Tax=Pseudorhodoferax sp. TaxID=1993553 RepID=UPI002DD63792|nr:cytochrome c [Pseudorhodoferax sp.]
MKRLLLTLAATATLAVSLPAAAQFQKSEDAIKYRQGAFNLIAAHFGRVAAMASGRAPFDAKAAAENAALASTLASLPFGAFGEGTDKGLPNRAKADIWKDAAKFKAAGDKMVAEMGKLDAAAKTGSLDAIKAAVGGVGGSCKGCHDDFRAERYSN